MNPAPFLRLELFQWFILLYAVFGMPNKPPYPDLFSMMYNEVCESGID